MNEEILKKLYESAKSVFDMPSYEQFALDMQDDTKLNSFRQSMSQHYDMPEIDKLKADLGFVKKKEDTESVSLDGSLESRPISELEFDGDTEFQKKNKAAGLNKLSTLARIPAFIQEQVITAFGSEEDKKLLNDMPFEQRETALAAISVPSDISAGWRESSESLRQKAKEIESTIEQYDQSITEDIGDLQFGRAAYRLFNEVGGAIPSIMQAMVPVVGLASMGMSTAAGKSRELQEEGEGLSLKTSATAALYGTAEAALETVTRGIGKRFFKSLSGQTDEYIKTGIREFGKQTAKDFGKEGLSELGTEILQNMTDYVVQGDEDAFNKELSHYMDIFIIGGFATTPLSAGGQGIGLARQVAQKRELGRKLESSKYTDLTSTFVDPTIDTDTEMVAEPQNKKFLKFDLDQKVEKGELTQVEADQAIKNFENAIYVKNELKGLEIPAVHRTNIANLILEKRDLKTKVEGKDPVLVAKDVERIKTIDTEIKNFIETEQELQQAEAVVEPIVGRAPAVTQPAPQKVSDVINRPITLTELGGSTLENPIEGEMYVDGQQVVIEDADGNLTEIGNVDEISDSSLEEMGIKIAEPEVKTMSDGNLQVGEDILVPDKKGIKRNKRGEISRVVLRNEDGSITRTLRGANAEEAAYQILLKEATSPEQAETINQLLEQDEEFQNELRKVTEPTEAEATADTKQATKQQYVQELKQIKESNPKQYWTVSEVSEDVAEKGTLIDDNDGSALVKEDGDIIGVYKKLSSKAKGVAQKLLQKAVEAGGVKLDNFDNYLTPIYKKAGFRVAGRVAFNEEFAPDGWKPEFGKPDVVAMIYDPNNDLDIEEKTFDDYDQMIEYRDSFLPSQAIQSEVNKLSGILRSPDVKAQINNVVRSLSRIAPDVKFVVFDNEADYIKSVGNNSSGSYDPNARVVSINASKASPTTVAHETFHAIVTNLVKTDAEAKKLTERMMKAVSRNAPLELRQYINEFAADYDTNIQSEEKLAELVGVMSSEYGSLPTDTQGLIKKWLDSLAKLIGIKPFTDAEVIDVLNTISGKIAAGDEISFEDVKVLGDPNTVGDKMSKRFQANFTDKLSGLTFEYDANTERFQQLEQSGFITKDRELSDFNGDTILLHQPDAAFSGTIMKNDEVLVEGKGGVFYPIKFHEDGYFWASTDRAAEKMANDLNKIYDQNNGRILMALTSAPYNKLLSSTTMSNAVLDLFTSKAVDRRFKLSKNNLVDALVLSANKTVEINDRTTGLGLNIRKSDGFDSILSQIKEKLSADASSFADRKMFVDTLISQMADAINSNDVSAKQFGEIFSRGIQNKYFKGITKTGKVRISATNMTQAISEMFTEPILKEGVERKSGGQVYAILEMNGRVEPVDSDKHESYGKAIKSIDGQRTVLHILKDRLNWKDAFQDFQTGDAVSKEREMKVFPPSIGVSVQGLKLNVRKQVSPVYAIVRKAKDNGISDSAILKYLKDNNLDVAKGSEILDRINQEEMRAKQKAEGLFDPEKNVVSRFLDNVYKTLMSGRGYRPKSMQLLSEYKDGNIEAEIQIARRNVARIEKAIKNEKNPKTVIDSIDRFMRGDKDHNLPSSMIGIVSEMRTHLDNLSKKLVDSGAVPSEESRQNIINNLGSYLNRSYEVYDNKNYAKKVTAEVKQAAKNKLREIYRDYAEAESLESGVPVEIILKKRVDKAIDGILNQDEGNEFVIRSKEGSKNLKPLEQRKDIPAEIRALMGEYGDPAMNYVRSIQKVAAIIANQNFQKQLRKSGEGVYLFTEPTGIYNVKIAGESSESMDILAGMYTSKDISEAMAKGGVVNLDFGKFQPIYDFYLKSVGSVKYTKTILSLGTHAKNVIGNIPFMLMTGNFNFTAFNQAIQAIRAEYSANGKPELLAKMDEYTRLGIINQSTTLREIKDMLSSGKTFEDVMIDRTADSNLTRVKKIGKGFLRASEKAYQVEDDFFKIAAYESEKVKYAKTVLKKNVNELTASELKEASERAATVVKNVLPNYSRVGGYVKLLKALPIAGTFISFTSESVRTSYNTMDLTFKEIADPKTREMGIQRLAGIMSLVAVKAGIIAMWGLSADEEDEDELKNAKKFLPFYDANSSIAPTEIKDGQLKYRSISASDPHGYMTKVFNAYMNADNYNEGLTNALKEAYQPWLNPDMTFSVISEIATNRDKNGKAIFKEGDTTEDKALKITQKLWKIAEPGTVTSAIKIAKSENPGNEAIGQFTGFKEHTVDVLEALGYKSSDLQRRANESASDYSKAKRSYERGDITIEQLSEQYSISNERKKAVYQEAIDLYNGAMYLGVDPREIEQKMMDWGIPRYVVIGIQQGFIPDMNQ